MASENQNAPAVVSKTRLQIYEETEFGEKGVVLHNLAQAKTWAADIVSSGLAPAGLKSEGAVLIAAQTGMELGFTPMRALQACVVINGNVSLKGEAALAMMRASNLTELCEVGCRGEKPEDWVGFIKTKRVGDKATYETTFSYGEATLAGLLPGNGQSPWKKYPKRMLMWRAVGFHFRDYFSDIGNGLVISEEVMDYRHGRAKDVTPAPEPPSKPDPLFSDAEPLPDDSGANEAASGSNLEDEAIDADFSEASEGRVAEELDETGGFDPSDPTEEIDPDTGEVIPPDAGASFDSESGLTILEVLVYFALIAIFASFVIAAEYLSGGFGIDDVTAKCPVEPCVTEILDPPGAPVLIEITEPELEQ